MANFEAPVKEMLFILNSVLHSGEHYSSLSIEDATPDIIKAVIEEAAKFCEKELAPLNSVGDREGCEFKEGEVKVPSGFKEAYAKYVEGGWPSLAQSVEYGGQGLPHSISLLINEMIGTANWAWGMYPGLSQGAMMTLFSHGDQHQKDVYLSNLISGKWMGTMCLTEPQCGTDLGLVETKAVAQLENEYLLWGNKIFISAGEHNITENIVHIVLARIEGASAGIKGLSLFLVPKFLSSNGACSARNNVHCTGIEEKMGLHGSATCSLNFEGATGFLIGGENEGIQGMFTFMNAARLGTAIQGLSHTQWAFQQSLEYAQNRRQMRALSKKKTAQQNADLIIEHPAVRNLLLTQKAFAQGGRALIYYCGFQIDKIQHANNTSDVDEAEDLLGFLTPIAKAFLTEVGFESANHGLQVFGGHGFIRDWGMEQNVRDARVSTLYEGTTEIQALDLLGRKVLLSKGRPLKKFIAMIQAFCASSQNEPLLSFIIEPLQKLCAQWQQLTLSVGMRAINNREEVGAAAVDYLMYSGYITLAFFWGKIAKTALHLMKEGDDELLYHQTKVKTAEFYVKRILPRTAYHAAIIEDTSASLMDTTPEHLKY